MCTSIFLCMQNSGEKREKCILRTQIPSRVVILFDCQTKDHLLHSFPVLPLWGSINLVYLQTGDEEMHAPLITVTCSLQKWLEKHEELIVLIDL